MADRRIFLQQAVTLLGIAPFAHGRLDLLITLLANKPVLPEGWTLYQMAGQSLFPIYVVSGVLSSRLICYLLREVNGKYFSLPIQFTLLEIEATHGAEALTRLIDYKFNKALLGVPVEVDLNGGALPLPLVDDYKIEGI